MPAPQPAAFESLGIAPADQHRPPVLAHPHCPLGPRARTNL